MAQTSYFIGVDVGGTSIKAGVVDNAGQPLSAVSLPTEAAKGQEHGLAQMCLAVRRAAAEAHMAVEDVAAIGVGTPGTMDIPAGVILDPPNLKPWKNVPVRQHIEKAFGKPTAFQNDANAAAYGEYWAGVGRDVRSMVLFTLGTGIGCGIIIDDAIIEGEHSHGAEVGHIIVEARGGRLCGCGQQGHLEAYGSAQAVVARTREALAARQEHRPPTTATSHLQSVLDIASEITAKDVFDAAAVGDVIAESIVEETAFYLAVGAVNMMNTIDPDMVVFAGGMIAAGEGFLERIRRHVVRLAFPVPAARTQIVYASLGNDAGFIGAAGCARRLLRNRAK